MKSANPTNMAPKISVLLPVRNAERFLRSAVESVLAQTFDDFELLALDGGSTDRSLSILRELAAKDRRINIVSRENLALVPSLNELITMARGRYLARMDSDDICRPQRFEKQVEYLEAHPECVAVGSRVLFIDPQGLPICEAARELSHEEIDSGHLSGVAESRICHPSVTMRTEAVLRIGKYREEYRYLEDFDLFLRLAEIGRLANLPDVLLEYRLHPESICRNQGDKHLSFARRALQETWARRDMVPKPQIFASELKTVKSAETHRIMAWWALSASNLVTARKHAIIAFAESPLSVENLKVLACAIRGY